ncbi:metalloregulator ArsR/SmtB family transcription factor [Brevundimonas sp. S1H14]|jgi:DNA-binding transcriptional ArsR family regulator|uniref:ArsR/SmtB family transcription factor n=1 Tax=Brevundimonas TaxID=41275 RepID=UPI00037CF5EC|nr:MULTISPECIES: metalloregulator ArsR/SmtB family transcription factor [Brevundimonas]MCC4293427.1 metalloregulator ArsR/SmtB family transcription factor [Brevundimonas aurantiaca]
MSDRADDEKVPALDTRQLSALAETFRLLGDPTRLRILMFCLDGPRPVKEIADGLELSQTLVSHHLRLLRGARLVRGDRASRQVFYEVADHHVSHVLIDMLHHINEDAEA